MSRPASDTTRVVVLDGRPYEERADGTLAPIASRTDWARIDALDDHQATRAGESDPDARPFTEEDWAAIEIDRPDKVPVGLKLDSDVLAWFKAGGRGYQTRINAVLRRYMEARRKAG